MGAGNVSTITSPVRGRQAQETAPARDAPIGRAATTLSAVLVAVTVVTCSLVVFVDGVLRGPAVMNGSARGTALVALVVAAPVLTAAIVLAQRGSARAIAVWIGSVAYLLYNAVLFVLATPFDRLFLAYVCMLGVALWSLVAVLASLDVPRFAGLFAASTRVRPVAAYIWVVAGLNAVAWLAPVLRATFHGGPPAFLVGTGMTTNPIYVQDLAFWLPTLVVGAGWLWRRRPWGYVVATAGLVYWVIESIGVAVDQWLGHAADPTSSVASASMTPVFAVLAVVGLVPLLTLLRGLPSRPCPAPTFAPHRASTAGLVAVQTFVGVMAVLGGIEMMRDGFGMPADWLTGSGFHTWVLPGVALLVGVAVPQLLAAVLAATRQPVAVTWSAVVAVGLVLWIVVQLAILQKFFFLQPVIAFFGLLELGLLVVDQRSTTASPQPKAGTR